MIGVTCLKVDIMTLLDSRLPPDAVVYVDPPYQSTTGYGFDFNLMSFIDRFRRLNLAPLFVSEGAPLNEESLLLTFSGAKGGISGVRKGRHQEWLCRF